MIGADFYEADLRLLQNEGRPVLLAQIQAAKLTIQKLKGLLAESPSFELDKVLSILLGPRGDEDAAAIHLDDDLDDDFFGQSNENEQTESPTKSKKRSGAPMENSGQGHYDENASSNQDQEVLPGARRSTPEEISNRKKFTPKAGRGGGGPNPKKS